MARTFRGSGRARGCIGTVRRGVAAGSGQGFRGSGAVVPGSAGTGFCARPGLCLRRVNVPVSVVAVSVVAVSVVPVPPAACDHIRINFVGLAELFLRCHPDAFRFILLFAGFPAQALGLHLGLLCICRGTSGFGFPVTGSELVGLGFLAHLDSPLAVRVGLALAVEEEQRCNHRRHYDDPDDDSHKLSCVHDDPLLTWAATEYLQ